MSSPQVSICIPVRNDARYVGAAIDSALRQSGASTEILVSDNASTDDTWSVISAYPQVSAVRQPSLLPMSNHWNTFRHRAQGEWVLFLCSDDVLLLHALVRCREAMRSDVDAVFFEYDYLTGSDVRAKTPFFERSAFIPAREQHLIFIIGNNFPLTTALVRRSVLDAVGWFDVTYNFCTDWHLWLKVTALHPDRHVGYLAEKVAHYRIHEGAETNRCIRNRTALPEVVRMKDAFLASASSFASPTRMAEVRQAAYRGNYRLARQYSERVAAAGDADTAAFYLELGARFEAEAAPIPALHGRSGGAPYPLPAASQRWGSQAGHGEAVHP